MDSVQSVCLALEGEGFRVGVWFTWMAGSVHREVVEEGAADGFGNIRLRLHDGTLRLLELEAFELRVVSFWSHLRDALAVGAPAPASRRRTAGVLVVEDRIRANPFLINGLLAFVVVLLSCCLWLAGWLIADDGRIFGSDLAALLVVRGHVVGIRKVDLLKCI